MNPPQALMIGTGEYTTGFVHGTENTSDKGAGVVALTLFDLRERGLLASRLAMVGTNGTRFPGIRSHLEGAIAEHYGLETSFESFPADGVESDPEAYLKALDSMEKGSVVTVFTPDHTHHQIAMAAIERGLHVLVAKPLVQQVDHHAELIAAADEAGVLCAMEVHKRWDPIYADARDRIRSELGGFSHFSSYMSQPKSQLETFRSWAGKGSDISWYLNAHHVDFLVWALAGRAIPTSVSAIASTGVAENAGLPTEDTITLTVQWKSLDGQGGLGSSLHTASWIAPKSDVHSQQRFHYMGTNGEVAVDQAHRGYSIATDERGFSSPNPLFMKYTPGPDGRFAGQGGYGYRSIEAFTEAAASINKGDTTPKDWDDRLPTARETFAVTAILQAGRQSLDNDGVRIPCDPRGASTED